jgi:phosphocarrier protein FPr/phosphocarrier protein
VAREDSFEATARRVLRVPLLHGLHARPSARLAQVAREFSAQVVIGRGDTHAAITSPSAMLRLGAGHGDTIVVMARGDQAEEAVAAVADMIASGMGEGAPFTVEEPVTKVPEAVHAPVAGDVLQGVTAAPGLAMGTAWRMERLEPEIAATGAGVAQEQAALDAAVAGLRDRLAQDSTQGSEAQQAILAAHAAFLDDGDLLGAARARIAAGASAALAWRQVMFDEAAALRASPDPRFAERAGDLLDLELRLQWQLAGREPPVQEPPMGAILIADDLLPSQVAGLDVARVAGFATARGGPTSHVAIIAASRGIAAVVAMGDGVLSIAPGTPLVLDAGVGRLEVAPEADRLTELQARREADIARREAALASAHLEGRTTDGQRIEVFANLGKLADAAKAVEQGAEGCGLLRTEFLFLDRACAPDEDEQTADYAAIARALDGRPMIVRLLDIGGDKPASYLPIAPEENPALGLRGIRVALDRRDILSTQLRAILRAGADGDLRVMAPMIARVAELREVRAALQAEAEALGLPMPSLGVMVETPAAAVMADALAAECDFLSVGTNDLTQYTLAMDRGNPAVAGGIDGLDPSVLRLIGQTCVGAEAHGKWVGVCGGLASDLLAVPILIGLGVKELSAAPAMVAQVKALVRVLHIEPCRALAKAACAAGTPGEVRALAAAMLKELGL